MTRYNKARRKRQFQLRLGLSRIGGMGLCDWSVPNALEAARNQDAIHNGARALFIDGAEWRL
jgi:hypothetical protein